MKIEQIFEKYKDANKICLTKYLGKSLHNKIPTKELEKMETLFKEKIILRDYNKIPYDTKPSFEDLYNKLYKSIEDGSYTDYEKNRYYFSIIQNLRMIYEVNNRKHSFIKINPIKLIPKPLKESLINYEYSYFNEVNISSLLMINYYFKLDNNIKEYLFKYETDFNLEDLEDITLYKDDKVLFYSCTHEKYNSLEE